MSARRLPFNDNADLAATMAQHLRAGGIDLTDETAVLRWLMWGGFSAREVMAHTDAAIALAQEKAVRDAMRVA